MVAKPIPNPNVSFYLFNLLRISICLFGSTIPWDTTKCYACIRREGGGGWGRDVCDIPHWIVEKVYIVIHV